MPVQWENQPVRPRYAGKHRRIRTGLKGSHRRPRRGLLAWLLGCG